MRAVRVAQRIAERLAVMPAFWMRLEPEQRDDFVGGECFAHLIGAFYPSPYEEGSSAEGRAGGVKIPECWQDCESTPTPTPQVASDLPTRGRYEAR